MLPPSQSWGTFPHHVDRSCWHWLCNQVIFFLLSGLWILSFLWENRLRQIGYYSFSLCYHSWGARDAGLVQSATIYQKPDFLLTLDAHMRVDMLLALPLLNGKAAPVTFKPVKTTWTRSQNQAQKETDIKLCWFLLLLNSGRTELGWTTHIISFTVKITCTTLLSRSQGIKQAPSDTKRGDLLMAQLQDGV